MQSAVGAADRRPGLEGPQVERAEVGLGPQGRVGGVEHLEPAVAEEAVDDVGRHPPAGPVGRVEDHDVEPAPGEHPGGAQPREPRPDDDDVVARHVPTAAASASATVVCRNR